MSDTGAAKFFKRTVMDSGNYYLNYENGVLAGRMYREIHGEWVITLEQHSGYMAAHHLQGIAEHLNELNQDTYAKEMMEFKDRGLLDG